MKFFKTFLLIAIFFTATVAITSCGNKGKAKTEQAKQGKEYTSAYICPMHCEGSGSDKMGNCPVCGMDYKKNDDHKSDNHDHDGHNHEGHNH
ncbi:MAG: heavy metal-binding domain-containing protein [Saprospiraceae bacterium]